MTNAVSGTADRTRDLAQKTVNEHGDLVGLFIAGIVAAVLLRYATAVTHPRAIHAVLAVVGALAIVAAYLLVSRAKVSSEWKLAAVVGTGVVSALCFRLLTMLTG